MNTVAIVVAVLVIVAIVALVVFVSRNRKRRELRERFGPEYERAVSARGDRGAAESELEDRMKRRESLRIVELEPQARERYAESWRSVQARFVDDPVEAVREADRLVTQVMRDRGYPIDDFEQRAADVSVDHPRVVEDYRRAHAISETNERGEATTEELRDAMVAYRSLFQELLGTPEQGSERESSAGERRLGRPEVG
jgi:FtsZ-interacting cell division protein ZipA